MKNYWDTYFGVRVSISDSTGKRGGIPVLQLNFAWNGREREKDNVLGVASAVRVGHDCTGPSESGGCCCMERAGFFIQLRHGQIANGYVS